MLSHSAASVSYHHPSCSTLQCFVCSKQTNYHQNQKQKKVAADPLAVFEQENSREFDPQLKQIVSVLAPRLGGIEDSSDSIGFVTYQMYGIIREPGLIRFRHGDCCRRRCDDQPTQGRYCFMTFVLQSSVLYHTHFLEVMRYDQMFFLCGFNFSVIFPDVALCNSRGTVHIWKMWSPITNVINSSVGI